MFFSIPIIILFKWVFFSVTFPFFKIDLKRLPGAKKRYTRFCAQNAFFLSHLTEPSKAFLFALHPSGYVVSIRTEQMKVAYEAQ